MKEAVTKVIDTLTQEDFHGAFQKLLERYNKCIAAGGEYFEGDLSFICVLSIKVPIRKKSGNLFNDPSSYTRFYSFTLKFWRIFLNLEIKEYIDWKLCNNDNKTMKLPAKSMLNNKNILSQTDLS